MIAALDRARRALLRVAVAIAPLRWIFVDPRRRIVAGGLGAVALAFALAAWQPLVSLWLGAALFGVPHVVAGVRHVAVRDRVEPLTKLACVAALGVGAAELAGVGDAAVRAYVVLFAAALHAELAAAQSLRRRTGWHALVVAVTLAALPWPRASLVALSHLHGVGAVAFFAVRARRRGVPAWPLVGAAALVMLGGAAGAFDALFAPTLYAPRSAAASIVAEAAGSALPTASALALRRALFVYAFGQALHFAVWLRLVPELDRPSPLPWTVRRAWAAFAQDLGRWARPLVAGSVAAIVVLFVAGGAAREAYFALTYAHVGLEAAALARALARGGAPAVAWGKRPAMLPLAWHARVSPNASASAS